MARIIAEHGATQSNLSMFTEADKAEILRKVAQIYMRQNKTADLINLVRQHNLTEFNDVLKDYAKQCADLGDFERAAKIYEELGETLMAEFIRKNAN